MDILTGRASKFTYLIAPVLFAMSWVLIMIITGSRSVSFHDRMVQSKRVSLSKQKLFGLQICVKLSYNSQKG